MTTNIWKKLKIMNLGKKELINNEMTLAQWRSYSACMWKQWANKNYMELVSIHQGRNPHLCPFSTTPFIYEFGIEQVENCENTDLLSHVTSWASLTCSFQTCLITERVASFQHRDDLSSAISLSAGSLAFAADL